MTTSSPPMATAGALMRQLLARLKKSPHGMRLARGAFWSLLGSVLSRAINLGGTVLVARLLGQESFGAIGIIQGTVGLFATLAGFGLGTAVTKYVAEHRRADPARAGGLMTLALGVSCAAGGAG